MPTMLVCIGRCSLWTLVQKVTGVWFIYFDHNDKAPTPEWYVPIHIGTDMAITVVNLQLRKKP